MRDLQQSLGLTYLFISHDRCPVYRTKGEPAVCAEKDSEPRLRELGPGRQVACHFPPGS